MDIFSILFGLFEEKDGEKILKIIGILFQYLFNISVPSIVLCIQCWPIQHGIRVVAEVWGPGDIRGPDLT